MSVSHSQSTVLFFVAICARFSPSKVLMRCYYHLQVLGLHVLDDLGEKRTDILADGHVGDDAFDGILASVSVLAVQVCQQLGIFAYRAVDGSEKRDSELACVRKQLTLVRPLVCVPGIRS